MESLPIDINYNKLLDWLINRRHCSQQWQPVAAAIRQKIIRAVENMADGETPQTFSDPAEVTYFHVQEMLEQAKDTDSGKKNFFGQYSSQNMKDWAQIIKLYEKDGIYLAETAQMIARNVNYEIPAVKKQITKCQQMQKECERKEAEFANNAADLRKKYAASCKQMGIEGQKIKTELAALVRDLPGDFDSIAASAQDLEDAVQYYDRFVAFLLSSTEQETDSLPMLKFVQSRGNVRVFEWRTGTPPEVVEEQSIRIDLSDEQDTANQSEDIDWGNGDDNGIDFGDEIDFGLADITVESGGQEEDSNGDSIDWEEITHEDVAPQVEEKGVARGEDALSVLDNPATRNLFIDDLMELESFLTQRATELTAPDAALSGNQFQGAPASIQPDVCKVEAMMEKVQSIVGQLTSVQMQHLMLIRSSPRYVDRLRDSLRQTLLQADKLVLCGVEAASRRRQALEEEGELEPRLDALRQHTRYMQRHLQTDIAGKYKGRQVNIMGEINMI
ncbi:CDK5 regulatory subunit-associated protein 3-like [Babylonia areolata]|uniref:CDK5 regulatory subunit-associated protein 3-like n=1 Tax=Babylonia areolata TaxID=304850 RepID=UPI003FD62684